MARAKTSGVQNAVRSEIAALKKRMAKLEAMLIPKRRESNQPVHIDLRARAAFLKARNDAMDEFQDREREQQMRDNPGLLQIFAEREQKRNDFLKSRGIPLDPDYTNIPPALRRKARRLLKKSAGLRSRK